MLTNKVKNTVKLIKVLDDGLCSVDTLHDETRISVSYIEQLLKPLRRVGLVEGVRGPGGGYRLTRRPITLADVLAIISPPKTEEERRLHVAAIAIQLTKPVKEAA